MARCGRVYPVIKSFITVKFCGKKGKAGHAEKYGLITYERCSHEGVEETDGEFVYVHCEKHAFGASRR